MGTRVLSREYIYGSLPLISRGYEAEFFALDKVTGLKVFSFCDRVRVTLPNKVKKIEKLSELQIPGTALPRDIVYDENGNFIGYTMEMVKINKNMPSLASIIDSDLSVEEKIFFYRKLEAIVLILHQNGIYLVDTNPANFLITESNEIVLVDTDSYKYSSHPADVTPSYFAGYYKNKTGDKSLKYVDEFSLTIRLLELILLGFHSSVREAVSSNRMNFMEYAVGYSALPQELKLVLKRVLSKAGQKEFVGPYLDCIADSKERYIGTGGASY